MTWGCLGGGPPSLPEGKGGSEKEEKRGREALQGELEGREGKRECTLGGGREKIIPSSRGTPERVPIPRGRSVCTEREGRGYGGKGQGRNLLLLFCQRKEGRGGLEKGGKGEQQLMRKVRVREKKTVGTPSEEGGGLPRGKKLKEEKVPHYRGAFSEADSKGYDGPLFLKEI